MKNLSDKLLIIWDERPAEKKFTIVCIVHYLKDTEWQSHIAPWARRGAIRLLPIAHQSVALTWVSISRFLLKYF